ncbi:Ig-like domain-containing protein [Methylobacterium gossipiicola]|uniref:Repeat domain-containing protein n=1 Tax=Methylobacterium gossipiicola TaxID=582675 RepID=A0A1I2S903_9HYPH|nr:Ig-like domain-containing protein [Methylobacterium gossipiicola]SFG49332.1 Repeat domain-containing protein [Methylobacterium gossipiicola]
MAGTLAPLVLTLSPSSDTGLPLDGLTRRNGVDIDIVGLNVLGGPVTIFDDRDGNGVPGPGEILATVPNSLLGSVRINLPDGTHSIRATQTTPLLGTATSLPLTVRVDNTGPTIVAVNQLDLPGPLALLDVLGVLRYEVTFSESVLGLTADLFQATGTLPGIHLVTLLPSLTKPNTYIVSIGLGLDGVSVDQRAGTLGLALNPANLSGVTDLAGNGLRGADFAQLAPVSIGPARETAAADFNADGLGDAAFLVNDTVVVTRGTGTGTLGVTQTVTVATGQTTIATGDVTGDGLLDIVTAGNGRVQILKQGADGTFSVTTRTTTGADGALVADVNGDGYADIVVKNLTAGTATVLTNNGSGTFSAGSAQSFGVRPDAFVSGDFNGDGRIDLAALANGGTSLAVLTQAANGTFVRSALTVGASAGGLAAGDLNGDGRAEIVSSGTGGTLEIRGTTAGGAATQSTLQAGAAATDIRIGDTNGDGNADILYAGTDGAVRVVYGDGAGGFSAPVILETQAGLAALALLDVNGDGRQDLALASGTTGTLQVGTGIPVAGLLGTAYTLVAPGPVQTVTSVQVAGDNVVNVAEAAFGTLPVTGTLAGPLGAGETLAIRIGGVVTPLTGAAVVTADGVTTFSGTMPVLQASGDVAVLVQRTDGATSAAVTQAVTVDLVAPTLVAITTPDAAVTKDTVIDFTLAFSEPVSGLTAANLTLTGTASAGLVPTLVTTDGGRTYAVTVPAGTAEGTLGLTLNPAGITDAAGNALANLGVTVGPTLTLDRTAPVLTLQPLAGDGVLSQAELVAGLVVTGTATGLEPGASVTVIVTDASGTPVLTQAPPVTNGTFALPLGGAALPEGTYAVTVTAADAAGNVATPAVAGLTVDLTADAGLPFTLTAGGGQPIGLAGVAAVPLVAAGLDAGTTALVTFTDGGGATATATIAANGATTLDLSGLDGAVTSTIQLSDGAGNLLTRPGPALTIDLVAPIGLVTPVAAPAPATLAFDVAFPEAVTGLDLGDFRVVGTGSAVGTVVSATANASGGTTVVIGNLSGAGTVGLALAATSDIADAAGNLATLGPVAPISLDLVAPLRPVITGLVSDAGVPGGFLTDDTTPTLTGTTEVGSTVTLTYQGPGATTGTLAAVVDASGTWTATVPAALANGAYSFTATAEDLAGNVSLPAAPKVVTIETATGLPFTLTVDFGDGLVNQTEAGAVTYGLTGLPAGAILSVTFTDADGTTVSELLSGTGGSLDLSALDGAVTSSLTYVPPVGATVTLGGPGATFDTLPPANPAILGFAGSGVVPVTTTNDTTPVLVGTGEIGSTVTVTVGGQLLTAEVDATGTWHIPVTTPLTDGTVTLTATAQDAAGNVSGPSQGLAVTVDLVVDRGAPIAVAFDLPAGRALNAAEVAAVTGTVSGIDADATATITFTGSGGSVTAPLANGPLAPTNLSALGDTVTATVSVVDLAGNSATLAVGSFAVDAVAPAATIVADPAALPGATSVTFTVTFPEAVTNLTADDFALTTGGTATGTILSALPVAGGYSVTVTNVSGTGSLGLVLSGGSDITDAVGNLAVLAQAGLHLVNVPPVLQPTDLPVITGITEDTNVVGDFVTGDANPLVSGTALPGGTITVTATASGGVPVSVTTQVAGNGTWSVQLPTLADDTYGLTATLTDASNTMLGMTPSRPLVIDTVADSGVTVSLAVAGTANGIVDAAEATMVSYTVAGLDADSTAIARFAVAGVVKDVPVAADGTFVVDLSGFDGVVATSLVVTDLVGNTATVPGNAVRLATAVTALPSIGAITDDTGIDGDGITRDTTPTLSGTAEADASISVVLNGPAGPQTFQTVADGVGAWTLAVPALADGVYTVTASATGLSGLPSPASARFNLTIDTTADAVPLVAVQLAAADTNLSAAEAGAVSFELTGLDTGSSGTIVFTDGTTTVPVAVGANGIYTADLSSLSGAVTAQVVLSDIAANTVTANLALPAGLNVDSVAPTGTAVADLAGGAAVASFTFAVDFSEAVANVSVDDFTLTASPGITGQITAVTGSGGAYVVTMAGLQGSGTLGLGLAAGSDITDLAGNRATLASDTRVVVGATPVQPVITGYTTDTGVQGDGITADAAPILSGVGLPGGTITILDTLDPGAQPVTTTVLANGTWSVAAPNLTDGPHALVAQLADTNGTPVGVSAPLNLVVDTIADGGVPATLTVDPAGDGQINAAEAGAVTFVVADLDAVAIGTVTFRDATHGLTVMDVRNGPNTVDLSGFSGPVTATLIIRDPAGNTVTRDGTAITVDTVAPAGTALPSTPAEPGAASFIYAVSFPEAVLNVTAEDFLLSATGTATGRITAVTGSGGSYTVTVADIAGTGTLSLGLSALSDIADTAGNAATLLSTPRPVSIGAGPQPAPTLITGYGDDTGILGDGITADRTPTLTGTAEANGTVTVTYVEAGMPKFVTAAIDANGQWSVAIPALADGDYSFRASAVTALGVPAGTSAALPLTIDTVADAVPLVSVTVANPAGTVFTPAQAAAVTFTVAGLDPGSTALVTFTDGSRTVQATAGADGAYQADLSGLTGSVTSSFTISDVAGNTAGGNGTGLTIGQAGPTYPDPTTPDPNTPSDPGTSPNPQAPPSVVAPMVTGLQPDTGVPGDGITSDASPTVTGTGTPGATVTVTVTDATGPRDVAAAVGGDGTWTANLPTLADGSYDVIVSGRDAAGNVLQAGQPFRMTLDTVAPGAPVVAGFTEDTGQVGNGATADTTPTLFGTAEAGSTVAIAYETASGPRTATALTDADGRWSLDLPTLAEGTYAFVASATDAAGNRGPASAAFALSIDARDDGSPGTGGGNATDGNRAPIAVADTIAAVNHAPAVRGNVLANDSDPNAGDTLHVTAVRFASGGTVAVAATGTTTILGEHGTLHLAADGSYSYQAIGSSNFGSGDEYPEVFTYTVADGKGLTAAGLLTVSLAGAAPVAEKSFGFAFTEARVEVLGETLVLTGPDGQHHDLNGIGTLRFTDGTIQQNDGHGVVDDAWYLSHNLDVWRAGVDADTHYATYGWHEGRDPNAYFSTGSYLGVNSDVAAAGINPLEHYVQYGEHEGRNTSANFSGDAYLALNPEVAAAGGNALEHYLAFGRGEGRTVQDGEGARGHIGAFDPGFYLAQNPDVAAAAQGPEVKILVSDFAFRHYLDYGASEGRAPNALFDPGFYLTHNPDVAAAGLNPLLHYEEYGWREGRDPGPGFDTDAYLTRNPDVAAADIDPLQHFLDYGLQEGRMPV